MELNLTKGTRTTFFVMFALLCLCARCVVPNIICNPPPIIPMGEYIEQKCLEDMNNGNMVYKKTICPFRCLNDNLIYSKSTKRMLVNGEMVYFIECQSDSKWSAGECEEKTPYVGCEDADAPEVDNVIEEIELHIETDEDYYLFNCTEGYRPFYVMENQGDESFMGKGTCIENQWDPPVCVRKCESVDKPEGTVFHNDRCLAENGNFCLYKCAENYQLQWQTPEVYYDGFTSYSLSQCNPDGTWDSLSCVFQGCKLYSADSIDYESVEITNANNPNHIGKKEPIEFIMNSQFIEFTCKAPNSYFYESSKNEANNHFNAIKMRLKCVHGNLVRVFYQDHMESKYERYRQNEIGCKKPCPPIKVKDSHWNIRNSCTKLHSYKNRARCTISCIFGNFNSMDVSELNLICRNGEWYYRGEALEIELKCPISKQNKLPSISSSTPMDVQVYGKCLNFATDPSLIRICSVKMAGLVHCHAYCSNGAPQYRYLQCTHENTWVVKESPNGRVIRTLQQGDALTCPQAMCPPLKHLTNRNVYLSNSVYCLKNQTVYSDTECHAQCTKDVFKPYRYANRVPLLCEDGVWKIFDGKEHIALNEESEKELLPCGHRVDGINPIDEEERCPLPTGDQDIVMAGADCVEDAANGTRCVFECVDVNKIALPPLTTGKNPATGEILCLDGVWQDALCHEAISIKGKSMRCYWFLRCNQMGSLDLNFDFKEWGNSLSNLRKYFLGEEEDRGEVSINVRKRIKYIQQ